MYKYKINIKSISKMCSLNRSKVIYLCSNLIPFHHKHLRYIKNWSDIITDYGAISFVKNDGSRYEYYLICRYSIERYLYFFQSARKRFRKTKVKQLYRKTANIFQH